VWLKVEVGGLPFNVRTTVAIVAMLGYSVHPQGKILSPLTLLDCAVAIMCISHITADSFASGISIALPFKAYGEWALPYVAGRFAIRDRRDLQVFAPWVLGVLAILGVTSIVEAVTKVNPYELAFGDRPVELFRRHAARLGLKRSFGPTTHPIFLGMMMAILMPWLTCMWSSLRSAGQRTTTVLIAVIAFAGTVVTISRTPVITILIASALTLALRFKGLRLPLAISLASTIGIFAAFPNEVTDTVGRWTGGGDRPWLIEVDGQAVVTSSSRSRLHIMGIYWEALKKAGPFGYGSQATTGFPLRIPQMEGTFKSANLFKMVDNGWVLLTLRFGWVGCAALLILFLTAFGTGISLYLHNSEQLFPGMIGCMLAVMGAVSLLLVFFCYDFALPTLWTIGILSGLSSSRLVVVDRFDQSYRDYRN
jgi:hypothetical protein